jgi:purine nucleosidase
MSDPAYWIDTDPGVDDALAILFAIADAGAHLVGLSSVHGNVVERRAAENLARILAAARDHGIAPPGWVPILARGSEAPLTGSVRREAGGAAGSYHGSDGLGDVSWAAPRDWERADAPQAAQAIVDAARRFARLRLICLGPLTNLALALQLEPDLPSLVDGVVIMGGSLRAGGNETIAAEFNFVADADAAQRVLGAGFADVALVPVDPCDDARMLVAERQRLATFASPIARLAHELTGSWKEDLLRRPGVGIYDLVAWALERNPSLARWEQLYVAVDAGHDVARGASVADWRHRTGRAPNVRVALSIPRREEFFDSLWQKLA